MHGSLVTRLTGSCLALHLVAGCVADGGDVDAVVGSNNLVVKNTTVNTLKKLKVRLPYDSVLANGPAEQLQLRGEDNLLEHIRIQEAAPGEWEVLAPLNMTFEQHEQVLVFAPFANMIELEYAGGVKPSADGSTQLPGVRDAGAADSDAGTLESSTTSGNR
jgi:hypothetical protein